MTKKPEPKVNPEGAKEEDVTPKKRGDRRRRHHGGEAAQEATEEPQEAAQQPREEGKSNGAPSKPEGLEKAQEGAEAQSGSNGAEAQDDATPRPLNPGDPTGPHIDGFGTLYLSRQDLLEFNALYERGRYMQSEAKRMKNEAELVKMKMSEQIQKLSTNAAVFDRRATKITEEEMPDLASQMTKKYGIDFRKVTYDDETGKLKTETGDPITHGNEPTPEGWSKGGPKS